MIKARFIKHTLVFKRPSATSRGVLTTKDSWFLILTEKDKSGIGECSILKGLSHDDQPDFEATLELFCNQINTGQALLDLTPWPAIKMGYETALLSIKSFIPYTLFPSLYTEAKDSISINGLVWMGSFDYMKAQIDSLLVREFDCIKIKIGAIDFNEELRLLAQLRNRYDAKTIRIRVDANGAFAPENALNKLDQLNTYEIDSIEQPIAINQWEHMSTLCKKSPIPIALDEELIGVKLYAEKEDLLKTIQPQYIILKPSLIGGIKSCNEWIKIAEENNIGWWATSALEGNVGLSAIAQFAFQTGNQMPQGLGTGQLFETNFETPITLEGNTVIFKS